MQYDEVTYWQNRLKPVGTINSTTSSGNLHPLEESLIRKYVEPYSHVLDYGIGGGRTIPLYYELHCKATGFDIADQLPLIEAKLLTLPKKYDYFVYRVIPEVKPLPYSDAQFDTVVSFFVLTHAKPENVRLVLNDIMRLGKIAIVSAYDDKPLAINNETYCFLHDYNSLFEELGIEVIETEKPTTLRFWVLKKKYERS